MTDQQRLFLAQARSSFEVFEVLRAEAELPHCHALHYLQMATELLGKANAWKHGPVAKTHRAFVPFLRALTSNTGAKRQFGYSGHNAGWSNLLRKAVALAEAVEKLAPAIALDGPNSEYPWPPDSPEHSPCEYTFAIWNELTDTPHGRQFVAFVGRLFAEAEAYL